MNKIELYFQYIKSLIFLSIKKISYRKRLKFSVLEIIGHSSSLKIMNGGYLALGRKTFTRSNFNIIVDGGDCKIGNDCFFNHNCSITCLKKIEIGDNCTFGNNLVIVDHDHNFKDQSQGQFLTDDIKIGNGTWVGANVVILRGSIIGENCVIAAGSIVRGVIADNTVYLQKRETIIKQKQTRMEIF
jgi:acetyltransferase-like isoleucine patch superfamily enzyme